ncbi:putative bifunctional diguanylate cyclase/phosphodiesterase [Pokkaliibacter sp. CJK22405]|uniref:putative bifunctional diguanylate cyclase/phosphodiesterase n=1 Tax=Pokkaliibacter sp. CJK22405 TaxID=3384615 RepID=UPI00398466B1
MTVLSMPSTLVLTRDPHHVLYWDDHLSAWSGMNASDYPDSPLHRAITQAAKTALHSSVLLTVDLGRQPQQTLSVSAETLSNGEELFIVQLTQSPVRHFPRISLDPATGVTVSNPALQSLIEQLHCTIEAIQPEELIDAQLPLSVENTYKSNTIRWLLFEFCGQRHCLGIPASQDAYRQILEYSVDGIYQTHRSGKIIYANQALLRLMGYRDLDHMQKHVREITREVYVNPEDRSRFLQKLDEQGVVEAFDCQMRDANGTAIWLRQNARAIRNLSGETEYIIGTVSDITQQKRVERALRYAEEQYRSLYENALAGLFRSSLKGYFLSVNPAMAQILGFSSPVACIRHYENFSTQLYGDASHRDAMLESLMQHDDIQHSEARVYRADGTAIWISQSLRLVRDTDGTPLFIEGSVIDITAARESQARIHHLAHHDALTLLPNRLSLTLSVQAMVECCRTEGTGFYLLMLDLDNFKDINDTLGHGSGDRLLQEIAGRLTALPIKDYEAARLGGDEFALLLKDGETSVESLAEDVLSIIAAPVVLDGQSFKVGVSIGIVAFEDVPEESPHQTLHRLLRQADLALYQSKDRGRNCYSFFSTQLDEQAQEQRQLEQDLDMALQTDEQLYLVFQPLIEPMTGALTGAEVLLRWNHPERGMISPARFIPLAERCGLSARLDDWVMHHACRQLSRWQMQGNPLALSVNLSAKQFSNASLTGHILQLMDTYQISPTYLGFELTETAAITSPQTSAQVLSELRDCGVSVALDDFGTGYSSLVHLQDLPVAKVKLDRGFIAGIETDPRQRAIVSSVASLVRGLGLRLNVEGVETENQLAILKELDVDEVQGFFFGFPMKAEELEGRHLGDKGWFGVKCPSAK